MPQRSLGATWLNNPTQDTNESQLKHGIVLKIQHSPHSAVLLWSLEQHMEESLLLWALAGWQLSNQRGPAPESWRTLTCSIKRTALLTEENHNIKASQAESFPAPQASQFLGGAWPSRFICTHLPRVCTLRGEPRATPLACHVNKV